MEIKMLVGEIIDNKYYKVTKTYEEVTQEEYERMFITKVKE